MKIEDTRKAGNSARVLDIAAGTVFEYDGAFWLVANKFYDAGVCCVSLDNGCHTTFRDEPICPVKAKLVIE